MESEPDFAQLILSYMENGKPNYPSNNCESLVTSVFKDKNDDRRTPIENLEDIYPNIAQLLFKKIYIDNKDPQK